MPIWYVTIYDNDGTDRSFRTGPYEEAYKAARQKTPKGARCCIHTGKPEHAPLLEKQFGNLVKVA